MEREDEIRQMAYLLWEQEGRPEDCALETWARAEAAWNAAHAPESFGNPGTTQLQPAASERRPRTGRARRASGTNSARL